MTPLEQKAREYAKSQCGYNVNCNPNESCIGCQWFNNHITQAQMEDSRNGFIAGYTEALRWRDVNEEPIPVDEEVIAKSAKWVDEDFNPRGIRVGFMTDHGFISAKWVDYHDCYMDRCSGDNTDEMPTHWRPIETI